MQRANSPDFIKAIEALGPVFTHKLETSIPSIDGTPIEEVTFRQPTGGDILLRGNPVRYDPRFDPPRIEFDEEKMFDMMYALSSVPVAFLMRMTPTDTMTCMWGLARFFIPGLQTKRVAQPDALPGSTAAPL